jgi:hypothetical protein
MSYILRRLKHKKAKKNVVNKELSKYNPVYEYTNEEVLQEQQVPQENQLQQDQQVEQEQQVPQEQQVQQEQQEHYQEIPPLNSDIRRDLPIVIDNEFLDSTVNVQFNFDKNQNLTESNHLLNANKSLDTEKTFKSSSLSTITEEDSLMGSLNKNELDKNDNVNILQSLVDELRYKILLSKEIVNIFKPSSKNGVFTRNIAIRLISSRKKPPDFKTDKAHLVKRLKNRIESKRGKDFYRNSNNKETTEENITRVIFKKNPSHNLKRSQSASLSTANIYSRHVHHFRSSLVLREKVHTFAYESVDKDIENESQIAMDMSVESVYF